jgi:hypothetical protein
LGSDGWAVGAEGYVGGPMFVCVVATGVVEFMLGRDESLGITCLMRECDGLDL